jgi:hypothetical protein
LVAGRVESSPDRTRRNYRTVRVRLVSMKRPAPVPLLVVDLVGHPR